MLSCLLANTLLAAVAAAFVLAIARWGRPVPATLHALWLVVLLKLLSPFGLVYPLPLGFETGAEKPTAPAPRQVEPVPLPTAQFEIDEEFFIAALADEPGNDALPQLMGEVTTPVAAAPMPTASPLVSAPNVFGLLMVVWVGGAGCVAGRQLWQTWRFARRARQARPAPEAIVRHVERLAQRLGVRAPAVRVLPGLASPVVWALGRPVLLWPVGLENRLPDGGRDAVLLHELAHLRRCDHWTRWLELAAEVVHWWNPLFWLARRQVRFQAELACDAWVTGTLPSGRRAYAEALLEVCSTVARAAAPSPAVGVGGDGRRDFQRRLTMIMRDQVPCRLSGRGKLAVAVLAAALLPGWVFAQEEEKRVIEGIEADIILVGADADRDKKLKELEDRIQQLTKELQALRGGGKPVPAQGDKINRRVEIREGKPIVEVVKPLAPVPVTKPLPPAAAQGVRVIVIDSATGKIIKESFEQSGAPPDVLKLLTDKQKDAIKIEAMKKSEAARAEAARQSDTAKAAELDARKQAEGAHKHAEAARDEALKDGWAARS